MRWVDALRTRFFWWRHRAAWDAQLEADLQFHLEQETADRVARGASPARAAREARLAVGSVESAKEACRDLRQVPGLEPLWRDLRYAVRGLRRSPMFAGMTVTTLAICLGTNLIIFTVVDRVLLRPLPFPDANRLATVVNSFPRAGKDHDGASLTSYYEWRGHLPAFASLSAFRYGTAVVGDAGSAERQDVVRVTPEFFTTLGVRPTQGRAFTDADMTPGQDASAIVTDDYRQQRFGSRSLIIGRTIRVDGHPRTIVGVLPPGFRWLSSHARIFLPLSSTLAERSVNNRYVSGTEVVARLTPTARLPEAQAEVEADYHAHASEFPWAKEIQDAGFRVTVVSLHADQVAFIRPTLLLLQMGALLLLLIGGANLTNLLLIRAGGRAHEWNIRRSLGAGRRDVARQVVVETLLLASMGGLTGLVIGAGGLRLLGLGLAELPLGGTARLDARVVLVGLAAAFAAGGLMALPVIRFATRGGLTTPKAGGRTDTATRATERLRHALIVAQIALAFVLLAGAGLLALSLERVMTISPGFSPDHVLTGRVTLPHETYPDDSARAALAARAVDAIAHEPGVMAAGLSTDVPVNGPSEDNAMTVVGYVPPSGVSPILHNRYGVTGGYFAAMGIPLRQGRFLSSADSARRLRVCVVDEAFARHYWPAGAAVGQRVFDGPLQKRTPSDAFTVVGVVGSVPQSDLTDSRSTGGIYFPFWYDAQPAFFLALRTAQRPESFDPALQRIVRGLDPDLVVDDVRSMDVRIDNSLAPRRSPALLAGLFAMIALLLAAIGTYGTVSFAVALRRREIGVRVALGARPEQIARQFLSLGMRLLIAGTLIGASGAWLAGYAMQRILFDVPHVPAAILVGTAGVMATVALAASLLPSNRAARLEPTEALALE
jgi:predicted permease